MDCMIAFDVGGTKTDAVLFDSTGRVLRRSVTPGANPLDVGFDEACRRYLHAIHTLLKDFENIHILSIYGGIACSMAGIPTVPMCRGWALHSREKDLPSLSQFSINWR